MANTLTTVTETLSIASTVEDTLFFTPSYITTTDTYNTTISAIPGQTVTVLPPPPAPQSTWKYIPSSYDPYRTETVTELDVFFAIPVPSPTLSEYTSRVTNPQVWTTTVISFPIPLTSTPGETDCCYMPSETVIVVPGPKGSGWNGWSRAQKGGLVAGIGLFVVLFGIALICLRRRRHGWVVHGRWGMEPGEVGAYRRDTGWIQGQRGPRW